MCLRAVISMARLTVAENNSGITFDSDWICLMTAKNLKMRKMTALPHASFIILPLDNHSVIVLAQRCFRSSY